MILGLLAGCGEWPPHKNKLPVYLKERKAAIVELVEALDETPYGRMHCRLCGEEDAASEDAIRTEQKIDGQWSYVENPQAARFLALFRKAGVVSIDRHSNGTYLLDVGAVDLWNQERWTIIQVFFGRDGQSERWLPCDPDHRMITCGRCKVAVDDMLWISYVWSPVDYGDDSFDILDFAEYEGHRVQREAQLRQCLREGMTEMGYELPEP